MAASSEPRTALTVLASAPEACTRWATKVVLLKVSLIGLRAVTGLVTVFFAAALGAAFLAVAILQ